MPSKQTYVEQREKLIFRCVYCGHAPLYDLPTLMEHEYGCELKKLRKADWAKAKQKPYARMDSTR